MTPLKRIRFGRLGRPADISATQWELPIALTDDNGLISLREVTTGHTRATPRPFEALEPAQQRRLTIARLRGQPNYPTMIILGIGRVDRDRAIALVEADTAAGQQIVACERQVVAHMQHLMQRADGRSLKRKAKARQDTSTALCL